MYLLSVLVDELTISCANLEDPPLDAVDVCDGVSFVVVERTFLTLPIGDIS